jgi:hypothetical protein
MAATFSFERVRHHLIPAIAALVGLGVAVGIVTVPSDVLNAAVDRGGFSSILPAAASPIGATGRTLLALVAGALIAACGFLPQLKAMLVARLDSFARAPREGQQDAPVVRRADAHPDAPPRRPIRAASDLGDPLPIFGEEDCRSAPLPPPVVQALPDDLDRPLADFDPAAVPLRPMAPPEPVAPLLRAVEPPPALRPAEPMPRFAWLAPEEPEDSPMSEPVADTIIPAPIQVDAPEPTPAQPVEPEPVIIVSSPSVDVDPAIVVSPQADTPVQARAAQRPIEVEPAPTQPPPLRRPVIVPAPTLEPETPTAVQPSAPEPAQPEPIAAAASHLDAAIIADESIAGLLARLERGAAQRGTVTTRVASMPTSAPPSVAPPTETASEPVSLDETLQRLRRLAAG